MEEARTSSITNKLLMDVISQKKKFKDVKPGESLFLINPKNKEVVETVLRNSFMHPKSKNKHVWVLEIYLPFTLSSITPKKLEDASKFGTKVTQQIFVNKEDHLVVLMTQIPTALATEKKYLLQWMERV